jgi:hypothetical protein
MSPSRYDLAHAALNVFACMRAREEAAMATVLTEQGEMTVAAANGLWLSAADAERATGWTLKPQGMCQDDVCVPLPVRDGLVDVAAFWRLLDRPVVSDAAGETWVLGAGAEQRNTAFSELVAPDFTLPDINGVPHTLSALRGQKVFLCTWASW